MGNCIYKSDDISLHDAHMDASVYDTRTQEQQKPKEVPMLKYLTDKPH